MAITPTKKSGQLGAWGRPYPTHRCTICNATFDDPQDAHDHLSIDCEKE